MRRDFTDSRGRARVPGKDYEDEPLIAVLSSHTRGHPADVQAGQALQRVLLTATARDLAVSFLSQLVEVMDIRVRVQRLIAGTQPPQLVLRVGYGWPIAAIPRQPADIVTLNGAVICIGRG